MVAAITAADIAAVPVIIIGADILGAIRIIEAGIGVILIITISVIYPTTGRAATTIHIPQIITRVPARGLFRPATITRKSSKIRKPDYKIKSKFPMVIGKLSPVAKTEKVNLTHDIRCPKN